MISSGNSTLLFPWDLRLFLKGSDTKKERNNKGNQGIWFEQNATLWHHLQWPQNEFKKKIITLHILKKPLTCTTHTINSIYAALLWNDTPPFPVDPMLHSHSEPLSPTVPLRGNTKAWNKPLYHLQLFTSTAGWRLEDGISSCCHGDHWQVADFHLMEMSQTCNSFP